MSRIGKQPVIIPSGVQVGIRGGTVQVKGPKGTLEENIVALVDVAQEGDELRVTRRSNSRPARANHGLMRALINNMVLGVTSGFSKNLEVDGVGYRAEVKGGSLIMQLGFSHPVNYPVPDGIEITADRSGKKLTVAGADKQRVGQVAAEIRSYRPPDHYKGKGVRYENERVLIKQGKTA